ncbi:putative sporulation protein YtaF [Anaerotaenia torta]|uniref:manganese efflux pump n=1 Tax=Anaerotaenia torta TaxID=433293 RepID=UPI003D1DD00D
MSDLLFKVLEAIIFVAALSTDALIASIAYGSNRIRIPLISLLVISFLCTIILGISLLLGTFTRQYIPGGFLHFISFGILFVLGIIKLLDNAIKSMIDKHTIIKKQIRFHFLNLNFILSIYANPKEADVDDSKILSPKEAISLAAALSIDNMAAGMGAALSSISIPAVLTASLLLSMLAVKSGELLGNKLSDKFSFRLSWLSGGLLILLAFLRLGA